jgi:predicted phosphoribosyltransferase
MAHKRFTDRSDAGRRLAERLAGTVDGGDALVLGVTREGVPVAAEIAGTLEAPLDVFLARRLPVPGEDGLWFGVVATGGAVGLDEEALAALELTEEDIAEITARELAELERRERSARGDRPPPEIDGRTALLVDDGLGAGLPMLTAVDAARAEGAARVVVAVPVAAADVATALRHRADEAVILHEPERFDSVSYWYENYEPVTDEEVRTTLA